MSCHSLLATVTVGLLNTLKKYITSHTNNLNNVHLDSKVRDCS